jgi:hypothetical protein
MEGLVSACSFYFSRRQRRGRAGIEGGLQQNMYRRRDISAVALLPATAQLIESMVRKRVIFFIMSPIQIIYLDRFDK